MVPSRLTMTTEQIITTAKALRSESTFILLVTIVTRIWTTPVRFRTCPNPPPRRMIIPM